MPCSLAEHALTSAALPTPPLSPKHTAFPDIDTIPLMHTLHTEPSSVLSVTADEKHIFSGSQGYDIFVSPVSIPARDFEAKKRQGVGQMHIYCENNATRPHRKRACAGTRAGQRMAN